MPVRYSYAGGTHTISVRAAAGKRKVPRTSRALPKALDIGPPVEAATVRVPSVSEIVMSRVAGWRIRSGELTTSQNVLMRKYGNKHAYEKLLARWADFFAKAMMIGRIPRAAQRRRLEITRYVRGEEYRLDRGNLIGGCKPVLDGAVRAGLIVDDREEHLDDHYRQAIDPVERVEILVCDAEPWRPPG